MRKPCHFASTLFAVAMLAAFRTDPAPAQARSFAQTGAAIETDAAKLDQVLPSPGVLEDPDQRIPLAPQQWFQPTRR